MTEVSEVYILYYVQKYLCNNLMPKKVHKGTYRVFTLLFGEIRFQTIQVHILALLIEYVQTVHFILFLCHCVFFNHHWFSNNHITYVQIIHVTVATERRLSNLKVAFVISNDISKVREATMLKPRSVSVSNHGKAVEL